MHKPWLYCITGIVGFQMVSQRIERHGRSRKIRNAHVLARCGTLDVSDLDFILDMPVTVALALLGLVLKETAAFAANDRPPSEGRRRKTGMGDSTLVIRIAAKPSYDESLKCRDCHEADVAARKGRWRRIRCHDVGRMRCYVEVQGGTSSTSARTCPSPRWPTTSASTGTP